MDKLMAQFSGQTLFLSLKDWKKNKLLGTYNELFSLADR